MQSQKYCSRGFIRHLDTIQRYNEDKNTAEHRLRIDVFALKKVIVEGN